MTRSIKNKVFRARPRIAIVGGNFAGLAAAQELGSEFDVTVIDRSPWFEWLPNIHELISGVKRPADLRLDRKRIVAGAGHRFVKAEVAEVDGRGRRLTTSAGRRLDFDACIVAVGGVNETYGVRGVAEHALPFKGVAECERIRIELAALMKQPGPRSIVIVGGGLEGIEALGEILRRHRDAANLSIHLVEAGPRLLAGSPASLDVAVRKHCAAHHVTVHTQSPVSAVTATRVRLRTGKSLRSHLTLWTGGASAAPLLLRSGLARKPRQWAPVTNALRSKYFDNVFIAGDAAAFSPALPKQAYCAMQMGKCAADNARRSLSDRPLAAFKPARKPMLIAFGDLDTFFVSGRAVVASPALAALKEAVYQVTMAEIDPPVSVAAFGDIATRLAAAARKVALPAIASAEARANLRRIALLRRKG